MLSVFHYQVIQRTAIAMQTEHTQKDKAAVWTWFGIGLIVLVGWLFFSQAKDKSDYNDALRITGAKVECRAEAKRESWSKTQANCDKLGTPGYEISTDNYFNSYKLRTGARGL